MTTKFKVLKELPAEKPTGGLLKQNEEQQRCWLPQQELKVPEKHAIR